MKIVKTLDGEINRDHNGVLLNINTSGIAVSDEVAEELHIQFGHLLDITDVVEEKAVIEEEQVAPEADATEEQIDE